MDWKILAGLASIAGIAAGYLIAKEVAEMSRDFDPYRERKLRLRMALAEGLESQKYYM